MYSKALINDMNDKDQAETSKIFSAIEEDIVFGRLKPRERLIEDNLMERFQVKRHVVRQGLTQLQEAGIVIKEKNKGAMVRDFSLAEVKEIYEMRELLQRHAAYTITLPAQAWLIDRLCEIHELYCKAIDEKDLPSIYHLNNEFHDVLFSACGNRHLAEAIEHYSWLSHIIRSYRIANSALLSQSKTEHGLMIQALKEGNRENLVSLCIEHMQPSKKAYLASNDWQYETRSAL
jgi:DNA-binding GntR family transcriptional regulator